MPRAPAADLPSLIGLRGAVPFPDFDGTLAPGRSRPAATEQPAPLGFPPFFDFAPGN